MAGLNKKAIVALTATFLILITLIVVPVTASKPLAGFKAPAMDPAHPDAGAVSGRFTTGNASFGLPSAYVAIIDANNVNRAYYVSNTDPNGFYQFPIVNNTWHDGGYQNLYKIYANHSLFGEAYSGAFSVEQHSTAPANVMIKAPAMDSSHPASGAVSGRVTTNNASFGLPGSYVAIVSATNLDLVYYETTSDANGFFQFPEVNNTWHNGNYQSLYRVYANHGMYGIGYSNAFPVEERSTAPANVVLIPDTDVMLLIDRPELCINGEVSRITAQLYLNGAPYQQAGIPVTFAVNNSSLLTPGSILVSTDAYGRAIASFRSGTSSGLANVSVSTNAWIGSTENRTEIRVYRADVEIVSSTVPGTMQAYRQYPVSVTVRNTGDMPWNSTNGIGLGPVGYSAAGADQFDVVRGSLPTGTTVQPGETYAWQFTMTAPTSPGSYSASYQMVWTGHKWLGSASSRQVSVTSTPNASIVSQTLPTAMNGGDTISTSVTVRNTGSMPWNSTNGIALGCVGYDSTTPDQFKVMRMNLSSGTTVLPGETYTFTFNMRAPYTPETLQPQYRMVWTGKQWFGEYVNGSVAIASPNCEFVANTIPASMVAGESYPVNVTVRNTGTITWAANEKFKLGMVGNNASDAYLFNQSRQNVTVDTAPGGDTTISFTMTAPLTAGTYNLAYQMAWEGRTWFGPQLSKSVVVGQPMPDSILVSETIPATMEAGRPYNVSLTYRNTGNMQWNITNGIGLGPVGYSVTGVDQFGVVRAPPETIVKPSETYAWGFTMIAPADPGTYTVNYQTVWTGKKWFGQTTTKPVSVVYVPNATIVSQTIPSSMNGGDMANVSITVRNTGSMPWNSTNDIALGCVGYNATTPDNFRVLRMNIPAGTTVLPNQTYTFTFNMRAPYTAGTLNPQYRMVWTGHYWFGEYQNSTVNITSPGGIFVSDDIPSCMAPGDSYRVNVTIRNTGTITWPANSTIKLGMVGNTAGDAYLFNQTRQAVPVTTAPGEECTISFIMTAPLSSSTLNPMYQMVWEGKTWFGPVLSKTVALIYQPDAVIVNDTIPSTMVRGQYYPVNVTLRNTGNMRWDSTSGIGLGPVDQQPGGWDDFSVYRLYLPTDTVVMPGQSYTWQFVMHNNAVGTYSAKYQMVWTGHQWFGESVNKTVVIDELRDAYIMSENLPASMYAGENYTVSVTVRNTGTNVWNSSAEDIGFGAMGNSSEIPDQFGITTISLANATPEYGYQTFRWDMVMQAPAEAGTYNPEYSMLWVGHGPFGEPLTKSIVVIDRPNENVRGNITIGAVFSNGVPINNATLTLYSGGWQNNSGQSGYTYTWTNLTDGYYYATAAYPIRTSYGSGWSQSDIGFDLKGSAAAKLIVFPVSTPTPSPNPALKGNITINAIFSNGSPMDNAVITLYNQTGPYGNNSGSGYTNTWADLPQGYYLAVIGYWNSPTSFAQTDKGFYLTGQECVETVKFMVSDPQAAPLPENRGNLTVEAAFYNGTPVKNTLIRLYNSTSFVGDNGGTGFMYTWTDLPGDYYTAIVSYPAGSGSRCKDGSIYLTGREGFIEVSFP